MGRFSVENIVSGLTRDIRKTILDPSRTVILNINTVDGFCRKGKMYSKQLEYCIPNIVQTNDYLRKSRHMFAVDYHRKRSLEMKLFPVHCRTDEERHVIEELDKFEPDMCFLKDSTNLFMCREYLKWLGENVETFDTILVTGGHTDLDIMQYTLSQQAYFNENGLEKRIIVVCNATGTYDSESHPAGKMSAFAFYNMAINGVRLVTI